MNRQGSGANIAALVGHAPIRMAVMGEDAWIRQSTQNERNEMANLLDRSMRAGAFGMSVSFLMLMKTGDQFLQELPTCLSLICWLMW